MFKGFWFNICLIAPEGTSPKFTIKIHRKIQKRCQLTLPPKSKTEGIEVVENFCENLCHPGVEKTVVSLTPKAEIIKIHRFNYKIIGNFNIFLKT